MYKAAILEGMSPKEYQDMVMQNLVGKMGDEMEYEATREQVINVATQKANMGKPVPMDLGQMENGGNEKEESQNEEWNPEWENEWNTDAVNKGGKNGKGWKGGGKGKGQLC